MKRHVLVLSFALLAALAPASASATTPFLTNQHHSTAQSGPWIATHSATTSGPWIATHPDNATIITANLASNVGETIPAPGVGFFLAINANGTVAWTTPSTLLGTGPIFVHDATGTRLLDTIDGIMTFGFDGTILRYGPKTLRLPR